MYTPRGGGGASITGGDQRGSGLQATIRYAWICGGLKRKMGGVSNVGESIGAPPLRVEVPAGRWYSMPHEACA
jgi:hypothetical protein